MAKNRTLRAEVEELVKENRKFSQDKEGLDSRMMNLRKMNKQLEKKMEVQSKDAAPKTAKRDLIDAQSRINELEDWTAELEDKLSFTVDKFEE